MGAKRIYFYQLANTKGVQWSLVLNSIAKALETMSVDQQKGIKWCSKAAILRHKHADGFKGHGKDMFIFHPSDEPHKRYFLLRHEQVFLEANPSMVAVLEKSELYKHKLSFTVDGTVHSLGDFTARVAQATLLNGKFAGIILEVEYSPVDHVDEADPLLAGFCETLHAALAPLDGIFKPVKYTYKQFGLGPVYSGQHSTMQYLNLVAAVLTLLLPNKGQGSGA
mmetsp:Transcript_21409/g.46962  ORF Transcript_21409/g.46962 Transcript_21409/m.46962 type:complete len:223 (-) Transcript_21409:54-722(-)|eukprot:CAMPEP_0118950552 /NCGR_PEP_ID=MMETSP1169-20130426/51571_1 /TAXON_ID=36882 /ORGANISM="Pyramimonas obovata, Strain CCMP722" /LENGTH=222 /DNA_ID=CAMNT_0006897417 /DNA_START=422 /DNA_END=1090 /DNA_ORIENTATION=-